MEWVDIIENYTVDNEENIVGLKEFIESPEYLNHESLSENAYEEISKIITGDDVYENFDRPQESVWLWGKGSGKSLIGVLIELYLIYLLLEKYDDPRNFFGVSSTDFLDLVNVGSSGKQSKNEFFDRLVQKVKNSPYFKQYTIYESGTKVNQGKKGIIKIGSNEILFPKGLRAFSLHSRNETYEGKTLVFFFFDESSSFTNSEGVFNAGKIYKTLLTSTREVNYIGIMASYPRLDTKNDFTYIEFLKSKNIVLYPDYEKIVDIEDDREWFSKNSDDFRILENRIGSMYPTWYIKPKRFYKSGKYFDFVVDKRRNIVIQIPIELRSKVENNPEGAIPMILAIPTGVSGKFMEYFDFDSIQVSDVPILSVEEVYHQTEDKTFLGLTVTKINRYVKYPLVVTIDAGESHCDAALTVGHREEFFEDEYKYFKVVVDGIYVWRPDERKKIVVDIDNITDFVRFLCRNFNVKVVRADFWNSASLVQSINKEFPNVKCYRKNANLNAYNNTKTLLYSNLLILPDSPYSLEFTKQFSALKPPKGSQKPKVLYGKQDIVDTVVELVDELWLETFRTEDIPVGARPKAMYSPTDIRTLRQKEDLESLVRVSKYRERLFGRKVGRGYSEGHDLPIGSFKR